mmetsp:Transcript_69633/g.151513  ORF Transcript_69633/g.151513 Transcript_69633/m.151513 type:complete len:308 (-) Transcript_69633:126-1049(-)
MSVSASIPEASPATLPRAFPAPATSLTELPAMSPRPAILLAVLSVLSASLSAPKSAQLTLLAGLLATLLAELPAALPVALPATLALELPSALPAEPSASEPLRQADCAAPLSESSLDRETSVTPSICRRCLRGRRPAVAEVPSLPDGCNARREAGFLRADALRVRTSGSGGLGRSEGMVSSVFRGSLGAPEGDEGCGGAGGGAGGAGGGAGRALGRGAMGGAVGSLNGGGGMGGLSAGEVPSGQAWGLACCFISRWSALGAALKGTGPPPSAGPCGPPGNVRGAALRAAGTKRTGGGRRETLGGNTS